MKRNKLLKPLFIALCMLLGGVNYAWAEDIPAPVYFIDFSSTSGLTMVPSSDAGSFATDADVHFGRIFQNAASTTPRTNYLKLPETVFSDFKTDGGKTAMTIGFWVKHTGEPSAYTYAPLFAAYGAAPRDYTGDGTPPSDGKENTFPMICLQSRGLVQINCNGWCDFTPSQHADGKTNIYNTNAWEVNDASYNNAGNWLADKNWHYYTITITSTSTKVYLDGVLKNQWNLDGTSDGQNISGFFTGANALTYVCLGGNQCWANGDNDAAFVFDDFVVYDAALTAEQINAIIEDKNSLSDITSFPATYDFTTATKISPFDNGTLMSGTNVRALKFNTTAEAYFDSDLNTDGHQPYTIASGEKVTITINALHGYLNNNKSATISVVNSDGVELASYTYNATDGKITSVKIGGVLVDGFESFEFTSKSGNNNCSGLGNSPYTNDASNNPVNTISISQSGVVKINFTRANGSVNKAYSGILDNTITKDLSKIRVVDGINNDDRAYCIQQLNIVKEEVTEALVTYKYEDVNGNDLSGIMADKIDAYSVGATISELIPESFKATFYNGDKSCKYDYDSYTVDNDYSTIQAAGNTITLKFSKKDRVSSVTVNYKVDDVVVYTEAGSTEGMYVGETKNVPFREYVAKDGILYIASQQNSNPWFGVSTTLTADVVLERTVTEVDLKGGELILLEDLDDIGGGNADIRTSYMSAYNNKAYTSNEELPAGKYFFIIRGGNVGRGSSVKVGDVTVAGIGDIANNGSWGKKTTSEITISEAAKLSLFGSSKDVYDVIIAICTARLSSINVSSAISNGSVAVGENLTQAYKGDEITLTPTADAGYSLVSLKYNDTEIEPVGGVYKFVMPAEGVTITAQFALTLTDANISVAAVTYNGQEQTAVVKYNTETTLEEGTDYTITVADANKGINVGNYAFTIEGTGNYTGSVTKDFVINKFNLSNAVADAIGDMTYTGTQITPDAGALKLVADGATIDADNYDVSYGENLNVADEGGSVTYTAKGESVNFTGTKTLNFNITKAQAVVTAPTAATLTYNGADQTLVSGGASTFGDVKYCLTADGEFTTTVPTGKDATTYIVYYKVDGTENYDGVAVSAEPVQVTIDQKEVGLSWGATTTFDADGTDKVPTCEATGIEDGDNCDVTVTGESSIVGAHTAAATNLSNDNYKLPNDGLEQNYEIVRVLTGILFNGGNRKWATYYAAENLAKPYGVEAYTVTSVSETAVTMSGALEYIPAGVPVLLYSTETLSDIRAHAWTEGTNVYSPASEFKGTLTATDMASGTNYVLYNGQFVLAEGTSIAANRCYLNMSSAGAPVLNIVFAEDVTSVNTVDGSRLTADEWYTLDGRKLQNKPSKKGLYIRNGKTIVVR